MVQGSPSPLPAPRLRQAGVERGRGFMTFYEFIMLVHIKVYRRAGDVKKVIRTSPQHSPL